MMTRSAWAESHALIVVGLAGEAAQWKIYQRELAGWEKLLVSNGIEKSRLTIIQTPENKAEAQGASTRDKVKLHLEGWRRNLKEADDVFLILIGCGVTRNDQYQFQVRGPRLTGKDFCEALRPLKTRSLTVFATGPGGAGLAEALQASRRVIISATAEGTEINQTQFGLFWIEAAAENPHSPILNLLRATEKKVAGFYEGQRLVRSEHAQLRIGRKEPIEAPFDIALKPEILQQWTLAAPSFPSDGTVLARKADGLKKTTPSSSGHPTADSAKISAPDLIKEDYRQNRVRPSTVEEKEILARAPKPSDYPREDGVILWKSVRSEVAEDYSVRETHEYRILVFNMRLRHLLDRLIVPSYGGGMRLLRLKTITPGGKTIEVFTEDMRTHPAGKDDQGTPETIPFFAPGVILGSIVDYAYEVSAPRPSFSAFYDETYLQEKVSIKDLTYQLSYSKKFPLKTKLHGPVPADNKTEETPYATVQSWKWRDLPARVEEPDSVYRDVRSLCVMAGSYKGWKEFAEWARRIMRGAAASSEAIRETACSLTRNLKDDDAKIRAVFDYVSSLRYVAIEMGANAFRPHTANSVLMRQYGDCKDKANLLIALLNEAGISAQFALVARARPFDESFVGFQFNHAIAVTRRPEGLLWLDATDEACPFGMMPPGDPGQRALVFEKDDEHFETITPFADWYDPATRCEVEMEWPSGNEIARGKAVVQLGGFPDYFWRSRWRHSSSMDVERELFHYFRKVWHPVTVKTVKIAAPESLSQHMILEAELEWPVQFSDKPVVTWPGPLLPLNREVDGWKRQTTQQLNEGYPLAFEQKMVIKMPGQRFSFPMDGEKSGQVGKYLSFKVTTRQEKGGLIRRSTLKVSNPEIPVVIMEEVRKNLDAWALATEAPVDLPGQ
ncbi:MAG: DUF3857 domain-containing protein [Verrucomicrobiae bacterium]|nr:DUF3857 domain-containing protein [Verrucomicrobiae bacterium]